DPFNQTIVLTLSAGSFVDGIGSGHITLGGDFTGISVSNVTKTSSGTISIQLSGTLVRSTGVGVITIAANATTENSFITAYVAVNPIPPPATALITISIREGNDGSGQELIIGFDPYNGNYSLQVEKETSSVKVAVTAAPGTTAKVYLGADVVTDGAVALIEGENIVKVIVSEANRSDRIYEITIQRGLADECFIATAAFGSKFEPAVAMLRHFRDQYLLTNKLGTAFVKFYYRHSPPIAAWIAGSDNLRMFTRLALTPVIAVVYLLYHPAVAGVIGFGLLLLLILYYRRRRRILLRVPQ
ncbi:MAG: lipoprotein, partial [Firmicutes bacterium]|nr:lipoprotein [Bacillota bacterium]